MDEIKKIEQMILRLAGKDAEEIERLQRKEKHRTSKVKIDGIHRLGDDATFNSLMTNVVERATRNSKRTGLVEILDED
jgi:hypothetical protein